MTCKLSSWLTRRDRAGTILSVKLSNFSGLSDSPLPVDVRPLANEGQDEEEDRALLVQQILSLDERFYELVRAGAADEWLQLDLTMPQLKVLLLLSNNPEGITMGRLAAALRVTLPTVTGVVDRLVDQGLVRRRGDPHDRRLVAAQLTEQGRQLLSKLRSAGRSELAATLERLSLEELRVVARGLDLLLSAGLARRKAGLP